MWQEQLHEELLVEILSRLPVQPLLRFRCVSKTWKSLIDSSSFIKSHLSKNPHSKIYLFEKAEYGSLGLCRINLNYAEVDLLNCSNRILFQSLTLPVPSPFGSRVVGSCDGLMCFSTRSFTEVFLVNPSTREYRLLPPITEREECYDAGLGYDCCANEYKFVVIAEKGNRVNIYGSKSNTWRQINVSPKYNSNYNPCYGKYTHGALHWIVELSPVTKRTFKIAAFDLTSEKFTAAEYERDLFGNPTDVVLEILGGQLCLCCEHFVEGAEVDYIMHIWVMEKYGVRESWSKLVSFGSFITILAFSNCGRHLLLQVDSPNSRSLNWYDMDTKYMECINTDDFSNYDVCLQSLIRLEHKLPLGDQRTRIFSSGLFHSVRV